MALGIEHASRDAARPLTAGQRFRLYCIINYQKETVLCIPGHGWRFTHPTKIANGQRSWITLVKNILHSKLKSVIIR